MIVIFAAKTISFTSYKEVAMGTCVYPKEHGFVEESCSLQSRSFAYDSKTTVKCTRQLKTKHGLQIKQNS